MTADMPISSEDLVRRNAVSTGLIDIADPATGE
jgi:hypothetical protein